MCACSVDYFYSWAFWKVLGGQRNKNHNLMIAFSCGVGFHQCSTLNSPRHKSEACPGGSGLDIQHNGTGRHLRVNNSCAKRDLHPEKSYSFISSIVCQVQSSLSERYFHIVYHVHSTFS